MPFTPASQYAGAFVQASWFAVPHTLQLGARASLAQISPLTLGGRVRDEAPLSDLRRELSGLVSYYRHAHKLRLGLQYSFFDWGARSGKLIHQWAGTSCDLEGQVGF